MIRTLAKSLAGSGDFESKDFLIKVKHYLSSHIHFDSIKKDAKRPLLRHTAAEILISGYGFCGENARVAILLLNYSKIPAARLYLFGNIWRHVVVEHKWQDKWFLFDAHNDPAMLLPDDLVASIPSSDLKSFPNGHREHNVWVSSCRIKIFKRYRLLAGLSEFRLPKPLIIFTESPDLIKAFFCLGAAILILLTKQTI